MVEATIALPVFCTVLFAIKQFGITFNNYLTLTDAARAGARRAAVSREAASPVAATVSQVRSAASDLKQTGKSTTEEPPLTPASRSPSRRPAPPRKRPPRPRSRCSSRP